MSETIDATDTNSPTVPPASGGLPILVPKESALHWVGRAAVVVVPLAYLFIRVLGYTGIAGGGWTTSGIGLLADAFIVAIAVMGVNLITGFTGQLSIGHAAFFALGAYVGIALADGRVSTPFFGTDNEWSPGWTIPVAALLCFVVGCVVGLPALRLKGIYLALTTLVFVEAVRATLKYEKFADVTGGSAGVKGDKYSPPDWTSAIGLDGRADLNTWFVYLSLGLLLLIMVLVSGLMRSRIGRAMIATRDNELAAEVMGVNLSVIKTVVFGLSGAITGVGGALFGLKLGLVDGEVPLFGLIGAVTFLVAMVVGGAAQVWGPMVGAVFYVFVNQTARSAGEAPKDYKWAFVLFAIVIAVVAVVLAIRWIMTNSDRLASIGSQPASWTIGAALSALLGLLVVVLIIRGALSVGDTKLDGLGGVIFGVLLILAARFAPFGIVGTARLARNFLVRVVPSPPIDRTTPPND